MRSKKMNQLDRGDHASKRTALRTIGPMVLGVGLLFTAIGLISFFSSFGGGGFPQYFWCAFIGLPLSSVGLMICKFAFMGTVMRYAANEVAPVGKDAVNYMVDGTKDSIRDVATAVGRRTCGRAWIRRRADGHSLSEVQ